MNIEEIKKSVEYIKSKRLDSKGAIEYLQNVPLMPNEKNAVYFYCFPRPLADYGLPPRIQEHRRLKGIGNNGDESEMVFVLEACKTEQYGRFMKHLMHAFGNPENVRPVAGSGIDTCCICGKDILEFDIFTDPHALSYGSSDSSSNICVDCLGRLIGVMEIIEELDPSFLNWTKRYQEALKNINPI